MEENLVRILGRLETISEHPLEQLVCYAAPPMQDILSKKLRFGCRGHRPYPLV